MAFQSASSHYASHRGGSLTISSVNHEHIKTLKVNLSREIRALKILAVVLE
jgi:hypothetical protein